MHRRLAAVLLAAVLTLAVGAGLANAASSAPDGHDVDLVNGERAANGLASLAWATDLAQLAQQHAADMAAQHQLSHQSLAPIDGKSVGENVGYGSTIDQIHSMFMQSSVHRANILGDYAQIGVGVAAASDGSLYVDELYRLPWSSTATTVAPAPQPQPQPVATVTGDPAPDAAPATTRTTEPPAATEPTTAPPATEAPSTTSPPTTTTAPIPVTEIATVPVATVRPALPVTVDDHRALALLAAACIAAVVWGQLWGVATERLR